MTHLDTEIKRLKSDTLDMWHLVLGQLTKSREALLNADAELASQVLSNERKVDAFELKLNMDCENILALFNPVANDLRFVLAVLRINSDLERIGDYTKSVARIVTDTKGGFDKEMLDKTSIGTMYNVAINMMSIGLDSFENESNATIRKIFLHDDELDSVNDNANERIAKLIKKHPGETINCLNLLSIIRKLERVGDQSKNIAEEIVFYLEAKVLRHKKRKEKLEK